jgi:hypothetical protein
MLYVERGVALFELSRLAKFSPDQISAYVHMSRTADDRGQRCVGDRDADAPTYGHRAPGAYRYLGDHCWQAIRMHRAD